MAELSSTQLSLPWDKSVFWGINEGLRIVSLHVLYLRFCLLFQNWPAKDFVSVSIISTEDAWVGILYFFYWQQQGSLWAILRTRRIPNFRFTNQRWIWKALSGQVQAQVSLHAVYKKLDIHETLYNHYIKRKRSTLS